MAKGRKTGGRVAGTPNKATAEVRQHATKYSKEAITALATIGRTAESESARVAAWKEILDRAAGKAPQALTDPDGGALAAMVRIVHEHQPPA